MIQIWGRNNSHNVQKVIWFCEEIGLHFKREDAGLEFGRVRDPDMLARNPNAVIPTIEDDGFVIWESNVILRHLARKYGGLDFYPESVEVRTEVERWMDWQQTTLLSPMTTIFWGRARAPDKFPKSEIDKAVQKAERLWQIVSQRLEGRKWIAGEHMSLAEVSIGALAWRWFSLVSEKERAPNDNLEGWFKALCARPAYKEHVMAVPLK